VKVAVVGTGYVGLVSAACLAEVGHEVACVDLDAAKIERINRGEAPILEEGLDDLLARNVAAGRLHGTTDLAAAMAGASLSLIAVGTPFDGEHIDLRFIRQVARDIAEVLKTGTDYHVVCVKSTVVPGTTADVVGPILESVSGRTLGDTLGLAMNPEFLAEGSAVRDFMQPDRIVIGAIDQRSADTVNQLYTPFKGTDTLVVNLATAEMIKYTSNAFLATVISFANEIANLCTTVGDVDVMDVFGGVHLDRRLSPLTAGGRVRPGLMSFLLPGTGFGGSCFPKDVKALIAFGAHIQQPMPILEAVIDTNRKQPGITVGLVRDALGELEGRRIAVLGLAFKPGTDDVRESPAEPIIRALCAAGATVIAHDPAASAAMQRVLDPLPVEYAADVTAAVTGVDAIVLVTSWPEYKDLSRVLGSAEIPVIDGRRFLQPTDFGQYRGIGRRTSAAR